jgi:type I restriction enzyme, S subunit
MKDGANVPKLRFPEFRDAGEWEDKKLGDLSEILRGGSPRPIEDFLTTDVDGLNWLKIGDVDKNSKYVTNTQEKVRPAALSKTREVNPGDLILSNSMSFGRPYILKIKSCIHDGWIAITEIDKQIDRDYLYYLITSPTTQVYFLNNAAGSGVQNLNADIIKLLPILFPQKSEQQKISDCLSSIDDRITLETQKLDTLKAHKKGLMQQLFPAEGETLPKFRFPEFRDSGEWEEYPLNKITTSIFDGTHQTPKYKDEGIPFFSVENIVSGKTNKFISEEDHLVATSKNKPEKGDILITRIGNIGFSTVVDWDYEFSIYVTLAIVKNDEKFNSYYLHSFMQSEQYQKEIKSKSLLNAVPCKINMDELRKTKILLPSPEEQQKIADCLSSIDEAIASQSQAIELLKLHKKGLMQQLFPSIEEVKG